MVWLKSQADETLPITPIGRTPERREIADIFGGRRPSRRPRRQAAEHAIYKLLGGEVDFLNKGTI